MKLDAINPTPAVPVSTEALSAIFPEYGTTALDIPSYDSEKHMYIVDQHTAPSGNRSIIYVAVGRHLVVEATIGLFHCWTYMNIVRLLIPDGKTLKVVKTFEWGKSTYYDVNELRQILRKAPNLEERHEVADEALADLDSRAVFRTHEVQRDAHQHRGIRIHALEIDVQDLALVRMQLEGTQHDEFLFSVDRQGQHGRVEGFLLEGVENRIMVENNRRGRLIVAIDDPGKLVGTAQTAARTRTLRLACGCSEIHGKLQ